MRKKVNSNRLAGLRTLLCTALILAMTFSFAFADKSQEDLKDEIEEHNQQSEQIDQEMSEVQAEIDASKAEISEISAEIEELQAQIAENEEKLAQQQKDLERNVKNLDQRLRNMYKNGSIGFIDVILSSENVADLIANVELVSRIYTGDKEVVAVLQEQYDETMALQQALADQQEQLSAKIDELTVAQEVLYDNYEALGADKAQVEAETASLQGELEALQAEEARRAEEARAEQARQAAAAAQSSGGSSGGGSGNDSGYGNSSTTSTYSGGSDIVDYALQFVGCPYVWGGTSLSNGCDCSGFTQGVYAHFGIYIPRISYDQVGTPVSESEAQAGDLVNWGGHVGIYMGNGQVVHASSPSVGIIVSNVHYRDSRGLPTFYRMY